MSLGCVIRGLRGKPNPRKSWFLQVSRGKSRGLWAVIHRESCELGMPQVARARHARFGRSGKHHLSSQIVHPKATGGGPVCRPDGGMEGRSRGLRLGVCLLEPASQASRAFTSESSQHLGNPPTGVVGIKPEDSDEYDKGGMVQDECQTV